MPNSSIVHGFQVNPRQLAQRLISIMPNDLKMLLASKRPCMVRLMTGAQEEGDRLQREASEEEEESKMNQGHLRALSPMQPW